MAWDEWEQLKADAGSRSSSQMQLNEVPSDRSGGQQGDLKADQDDLAAVGDSAFKLFTELPATAVTPGPAVRPPPRTSRRRSSSSGAPWTRSRSAGRSR